MGNSTITLQDIMDSVSTIGDLNPVFNSTGGWANEPALTIGNDVMSELLSVRYPWKWNRLKIPPFPLNSLQQDYLSPIKNLGWLENGLRVDVNNSTYPPPSWPINAVRDLEMSNVQGGFPYQVCWFYNRDLEQAKWPGAGEDYVNPIGTQTNPGNPPTNITDKYGNLLSLYAYGITGDTPPAATYPPISPSNPAPNLDADVIGQIIQDGTCQWIVMDPNAQGFRFAPMPPSGGNVWLVRLFAQKKAPRFTKLKQPIDPVPDDESKWFLDGAIAYAHRYSSNPAVKAKYEPMKLAWQGSMADETKQNDREDESKGFYPDRSVMAPSYTSDPGPYPYRYGWGR